MAWWQKEKSKKNKFNALQASFQKTGFKKIMLSSNSVTYKINQIIITYF